MDLGNDFISAQINNESIFIQMNYKMIMQINYEHLGLKYRQHCRIIEVS